MRSSDYEALRMWVIVLTIWQGLLPFVAKALHFMPDASLPARFEAPVWWMSALGALLIGGALAWTIGWLGVRATPSVDGSDA